jgi:hypothetical protein
VLHHVGTLFVNRSMLWLRKYCSLRLLDFQYFLVYMRHVTMFSVYGSMQDSVLLRPGSTLWAIF